MKKRQVLLASVLAITSVMGFSQEQVEIVKENEWFAGFNLGGALAFGDDSYNVFSDFKNANATSLS